MSTSTNWTKPTVPSTKWSSGIDPDTTSAGSLLLQNGGTLDLEDGSGPLSLQ